MSSERTAKRRCRWLVTVVTAPTPEAGLVAAAEPSLKYEYLQRRLLRRRACAHPAPEGKPCWECKDGENISLSEDKYLD